MTTPVEADPTTAPTAPPEPPPFNVRRLGPAGIVALLSALLPIAGSGVLVLYCVSIAAFLKEEIGRGLIIYSAGFALLAGVALLPTYAQAIIGGYVFGLFPGIPAALVGFGGGSIIGYAIGRRASGDRIETILRERPKWLAVRNALVGRGFWPTLGMVALIRLPPNSPFAMTNLVMASVKVRWLPFILGTLIGMTPRTAAAVFLGAGLKELTSDTVTSVPRPLVIAGVVLMLLVVVVIGSVAKRAMERVTRGHAAQQGEPAQIQDPAAPK